MPRTKFVIEPDGWECSLEDCPPGYFMHCGDLCFKTEYRRTTIVDTYNSAGATFSVPPGVEVRDIMVQPVVMRQVEEED